MRRKAGVRCQEEAAMNSEVGMRNAEKKKGASHKAHGARQGAIKAITNSVSQLRVLSSDFCVPYSDLRILFSHFRIPTSEFISVYFELAIR